MQLQQQLKWIAMRRRLDTQFVERYDQRKSIIAARVLADIARGGRSLLFFPEGTFQPMPGLRPFHLGAFNAAAVADAAVVPVHGEFQNQPGMRHVLDADWSVGNVVRGGPATVANFAWRWGLESGPI